MAKDFLLSVQVTFGGQKTEDFMHPPTDSGLGDAKDFGGLCVVQLLSGHQHDGIAKRGFQSPNGALQPHGVVKVTTVLLGREPS